MYLLITLISFVSSMLLVIGVVAYLYRRDAKKHARKIELEERLEEEAELKDVIDEITAQLQIEIQDAIEEYEEAIKDRVAASTVKIKCPCGSVYDVLVDFRKKEQSYVCDKCPDVYKLKVDFTPIQKGE